MRFGVTIPNNWGIADPRQVLAMGPLAEALGYDSVWVMDWAGTLDRLAQLDFTHIARAFLSNVGPVLATRERSGSTVERLAVFATWVGSGLAVGPLIGGFVVARLGLPLLYDALAVCIVGALVVHRLASDGPVYAIRGIDTPRGGS